MINSWRFGIILLVLFIGCLAMAQSRLQKRTLVINGRSGVVTFFEIDGHYYIDLRSLARIGNGSLSFDAQQISLNFPVNAPKASAASGHPPINGQVSSGMSARFMNAAIQDLGVIKEWHSTIALGLQNGVPGTGKRLALNRDKAAEGLSLAKVAATTPSDEQSLQLLTAHFNNVLKWYNQMVDARKNMNTANYSMSTDRLNDGDVYQKIVRCSNFLTTMIPSGTYSDDGSCQP